MPDGATQHAFSPTVLRERADWLDIMADSWGWLDTGSPRRLRAAADALRLLADLLDAIPDLVESWADMNSPMTSRNNHPHTAVPFMRHDAAVSAIAAALEAHRD